MTYIPKGTKRHWTAEEESLLAEGWGVCGVPALAKKLNRSQQAIKIRASRLHLGPLLMGGDYVTLNQLVTAFNRTGSYSYKMISWVENRGLPVHNQRVQQNTFRVVYAYAAGEIDLDYALSVITSYRGLFKDVTSDAFLEKMLDEFVLSRPALEA